MERPEQSAGRGESGLPVLGARTLRLEGEVHKLVTFLNQTLKDRGLVFGISKHPEGLRLTVYTTGERAGWS